MIMYFLFSRQREEIRGQQTIEKPDTTHPACGGSAGVDGVKVTVSDLCFNNFVVKPL